MKFVFLNILFALFSLYACAQDSICSVSGRVIHVSSTNTHVKTYEKGYVVEVLQILVDTVSNDTTKIKTFFWGDQKQGKVVIDKLTQNEDIYFLDGGFLNLRYYCTPLSYKEFKNYSKSEFFVANAWMFTWNEGRILPSKKKLDTKVKSKLLDVVIINDRICRVVDYKDSEGKLYKSIRH